MRERAERYTSNMAEISERVVPDLKKMKPQKILDSAQKLDQFDRVARRNFGLNDSAPAGGILNLAVLCNQAAVVQLGSG
jgi:hypothetical protein